jgi:cytoskeletal protein CcmA (bactofilin family)
MLRRQKCIDRREAMLNKQNLFGTNDRYKRDTLNTTGAGATLTPAPQAASGNTALDPTRAAPPVDTRPKPAAPVAPEESRGGRLTVGPDIKLKGAEITDCDTLLVEGRVEASMDSRVIEIAESGSFQGTVGIDIAEIRGEFTGELTARKRLVIHSTGRVSGTIRYGKLVIAEGGELAGDISSIAPSGNPAQAKPGQNPKTNTVAPTH